MSNILIDSNGGKIEAIYKVAVKDDAPVVLLLHPHPNYGGNMHNKVLFNMEKIFIKHGFTTLRFNFRSNGKSDGNVNTDNSELIDASVCLDWLQGKHPSNKAIYVAGISFGAYIALQLMVRRTEINCFVSVSTPTNMFDISFVHPCPTDGIFIHGEKDELCPLKDAEKIIKKIIKIKNHEVIFEVIKNSDHFFTHHLTEFHNIVDKYISQQLKKSATANNVNEVNNIIIKSFTDDIDENINIIKKLDLVKNADESHIAKKSNDKTKIIPPSRTRG